MSSPHPLQNLPKKLPNKSRPRKVLLYFGLLPFCCFFFSCFVHRICVAGCLVDRRPNGRKNFGRSATRSKPLRPPFTGRKWVHLVQGIDPKNGWKMTIPIRFGLKRRFHLNFLRGYLQLNSCWIISTADIWCQPEGIISWWEISGMALGDKGCGESIRTPPKSYHLHRSFYCSRLFGQNPKILQPKPNRAPRMTIESSQTSLVWLDRIRD